MIFCFKSRRACCIVALVLLSASVGSPLNAKGFNYKSSAISDENFSVKLVKTDKNLIACAAVNRKSRPTIFFNKTFLGSGSIGFLDEHFEFKATSRVVLVPILICEKSMTVQAVTSGHIVSFGLSESELLAVIKKGLSINGQKLDAENLGKLYSLVSKCLSKKN